MRNLNFMANRPLISIKYILIYTFLLLFIVPAVFINVMSYYNNINMIKHTMDDIANQNLKQTQKSLQLTFSTYDYMLYQIYTDRNIIDIIDHINNNEELEKNSIALTNALRSFLYGQSYVQAVSVITDSGKIFFFDRLKGYYTENGWLKDSTIPISHIYKQTLSSEKNNVFSTKSGKDFSGRVYYYCHIAHSIVDYKDSKRKKGIIILSINADVLNKTSNANLSAEPPKKSDSFCFIVDQNNNVVSFPKEDLIGKNLLSTDSEDITKACKEFIKKNNMMKSDNIDVQVLNDELIGWKLVRVSDNGNIMGFINKQYKITAIIITTVSILLGLMIFFINRNIFESLNSLIKNMKISKNDKVILKNRIPIIKEINIIYQNFEDMLQHINMLIARIKFITKQQKDYEIKSLEMQINPHFLYNSLDMINWMSIDAGQYQISDAIHSLAQILRYSITDINMPVTIDKEVIWLKRYLHLQQMRFKGSFDYHINISPEAESCMIYKMILQPFVENAILHGFSEAHGANQIQVEIHIREGRLCIAIKDNGKGMTEAALLKIRDMLKNKTASVEGRIGLHNVINRLILYYEDSVTIDLDSQLGRGTCVLLSMPAKEAHDEHYSN